MLLAILLVWIVPVSCDVVRYTRTYPEGFTVFKIGDRYMAHAADCTQINLCYNRDLVTSDFTTFSNVSHQEFCCGDFHEFHDGKILFSQLGYTDNGETWKSVPQDSPLWYHSIRTLSTSEGILTIAGDISVCALSLLYSTDPSLPLAQWTNVTFPEFPQCTNYDYDNYVINGVFVLGYGRVDSGDGFKTLFKQFDEETRSWLNYDLQAPENLYEFHSCGHQCTVGRSYSQLYLKTATMNSWKLIFPQVGSGGIGFDCSDGYCVVVQVSSGKVFLLQESQGWAPTDLQLDLPDAYISSFPGESFISDHDGEAYKITVPANDARPTISALGNPSPFQGRILSLAYASQTTTTPLKVRVRNSARQNYTFTGATFAPDTSEQIVWAAFPCANGAAVSPDGTCLYNIAGNVLSIYGHPRQYWLSAPSDWTPQSMTYVNGVYLFLGLSSGSAQLYAADALAPDVQLTNLLQSFAVDVSRYNPVLCANQETVLLNGGDSVLATNGTSVYRLDTTVRFQSWQCSPLGADRFVVCGSDTPYVFSDGGRTIHEIGYYARCMAAFGTPKATYYVDGDGHLQQVYNASRSGVEGTTVFRPVSAPIFFGEFGVANNIWLLGHDVYRITA